jgi:hypothetical protein
MIQDADTVVAPLLAGGLSSSYPLPSSAGSSKREIKRANVHARRIVKARIKAAGTPYGNRPHHFFHPSLLHRAAVCWIELANQGEVIVDCLAIAQDMESKLRSALVCKEAASKLPDPRLATRAMSSTYEIQITRVKVKRDARTSTPIRCIKLAFVC